MNYPSTPNSLTSASDTETDVRYGFLVYLDDLRGADYRWSITNRFHYKILNPSHFPSWARTARFEALVKSLDNYMRNRRENPAMAEISLAGATRITRELADYVESAHNSRAWPSTKTQANEFFHAFARIWEHNSKLRSNLVMFVEATSSFIREGGFLRYAAHEGRVQLASQGILMRRMLNFGALDEASDELYEDFLATERDFRALQRWVQEKNSPTDSLSRATDELSELCDEIHVELMMVREHSA